MAIVTVIVLLVLAGCGAKHHISASPGVSEGAEIDVVVSFLQQQYSAQIAAGTPFVIKNSLSVAELHPDASYSEFSSSLLSEASEEIPPDLIADFCAKNRTRHAVWPKLGQRLHVRLLSRIELNRLFAETPLEHPDGWEKFYAKYPSSPGIITLSRVGFNQSGDLALLYVGVQRGWVDGDGQIHVFRKLGGEWKEANTRLGSSWVS